MKNDLCWSVYVHTNKINGKKYVGITSAKKPYLRWGCGHHYIGCRHFYFAIQKYGWNNFDHKIVVSGISKKLAEAIERGMIAHYKTTDNRFGYNIQSGGILSGGLSPEGLQSLKDCNSGINAKNRRVAVVFDLSGKKVQEFCTIRNAAKFLGVTDGYISQHIYSRHGTCGGHIVRLKSDVGDADQLSPEVVADALSKKYKNGVGAHAKSVAVFDAKTGKRLGDFPSIKSAGAHFNVNFGKYSQSASKSVHGLIVRYAEDCVGQEFLPGSELPDFSKHPKAKEVFQFTADQQFVRSYRSLTEAAKETGTSYKALSMCLRGKHRSAGGFLWSFSESEIPSAPKTIWESRIKNGTTCGNCVDQIDLKTGAVIATYRSFSEAAKSLNTQPSSIAQVVFRKKNRVSCCGFGWKLHDQGRG